MRVLKPPSLGREDRERLMEEWRQLERDELGGKAVPDSWSLHRSKMTSVRYRLNSFREWPGWKDIPSPSDLAKWGFTYRGVADIVK